MTTQQIINAVVAWLAAAIAIAAFVTARRARLDSQIHIKCMIDDCRTSTLLARPATDWHRDDTGRPYCPQHPPATSCRICGGDKGDGRMLCDNHGSAL